MPLYIYQIAYTAESLAAQLKLPQDRLEVAARPAIEALRKAATVGAAYRPAR